MATDTTIRNATPADLDPILSLYRETIMRVNRRDYTEEQVQAWASRAGDLQRWAAKIGGQHFFVCEHGTELSGFASLTDDGHVDLLFVSARAQGLGIAAALYAGLEALARTQGLPELTADVSLTAKAFFEKQGFVMECEQEVAIGTVRLRNFKARKRL